jgi:hypothetical protein
VTELGETAAWSADWLWSVPLIAITVTFHVWVLEFVYRTVVRTYQEYKNERRLTSVLAGGLVVTFTTLATLVHGIEGAFWATAYVVLGALPDARSAMLYSLNAVTSYGHTDIDLAGHWRLMGALEALNGILLFGLTTAFMFRLIGHFSFAGGEASSVPPRQ